ncbi:TMV resistance protein N [Camellia lanceoleosa]|uniref:TMV resistance protein N n=1 Tax=Camellia lanceoleosa TaxID=1840588 RepID=A0ACC0IF81_9ERIC|nr:TMV resistance protein N [Camellia lanceoleosa]
MALVPFPRSNSSVPSSSSSQFRYDVFLSFRGTDTRHNFISHLHKELIREGIETYKDDSELERGKEISPDLLEAIEESRYSIVVISKNYASSKWCLDELVKILECQNPRDQRVYPVFFHVNPSEVGKQTGTFGEGFAQLVSKHEMEIERVQIWKGALKKVAKVSGFVYPDPQFESESKLIEEIVGKIISRENTSVDEGLVGINCRIEKVIERLDLGKDDGCVVGIWGMGGIGKTTLARAVYDCISCQFDGKCFLENVRTISKERGVMYLQEQLLHEISKGKVNKVNNLKSGQNMIERIIGGKKVLIVLDDVDESIGVEDLLGKRDWFNSGSKIIITCRDRHVLSRNGAMLTYKVPKLKKGEAVKLLKSKAFSKDKQTEGYENNIRAAVEYCNGLPLALEVLGSLLHGREQNYWGCELERLKEMPHLKIEEVLKISYNGLNEEDKEIFLHIAFFFKRIDKNDLMEILDSLGFHGHLGIQHLVEKSLITISYGELIMHDLIQDFGRNIVRQESPKEPGQRSRLWHFDDIKCVLMDDTGTEKVEGIVLEDPNRGSPDSKDFGSPNKSKLSSKAFQKLRKLKILIIRDVQLFEELDYLPNELRYLDWDGYPLRCMPSKFQPMQLVRLRITHSNIKQLWMETEVLPNLKFLDLRHSKYLTVSPDFEKVPNLEELILNDCTSLVNLHPSIGSLRMLRALIMYRCESLESIPKSIGQLEDLQVLGLGGCSKLENLPCSICGLSLLRSLVLQGCGFKSLPSTMNQLSKLKFLDLSDCKRLQELPELSLNILRVYAHNCESLRTIASPSIYKSFESFSFLNCFKLVKNKESNLLTDEFLSIQFQGSHVRRTDGFEINFPGSKIPKWFEHQSEGPSICLQLPPNWFNSSLLGIAIVTVSVGIADGENEFIYDYRIHKTPKTLLITQKFLGSSRPGRKFKDVGVRYFTTEEIQVLSVKKVDDELNENEVKFEVEWHSKEYEVKKCGIRLVYKEDFEGNDQAYSSSPQYEDVNAPLETRRCSLNLLRTLMDEEEEEEEDEADVDVDVCVAQNRTLVEEEEDEADVNVDVDVDVDVCMAQNRTLDLSCNSSSQVDNLVIVSQGVEEANNVTLKRRPSGSGDFQKEDCPNVKRLRLDQEFNTRRVTPPPNKVGARKKMKLMWMSRWHKRVMWIRSNQSHRGMAV